MESWESRPPMGAARSDSSAFGAPTPTVEPAGLVSMASGPRPARCVSASEIPDATTPAVAYPYPCSVPRDVPGATRIGAGGNEQVVVSFVVGVPGVAEPR
jgi:hypothetical protein